MYDLSRHGSLLAGSIVAAYDARIYHEADLQTQKKIEEGQGYKKSKQINPLT